MKKFLLIISGFLLIAVVSIVWFINGLMPVGLGNVKHFEIMPGETAAQIGQNLQKEKLIKNAVAFRIYSQITQAAKNIKPGTYELKGNLWTPQVINKLLEGPTELWITIPEGFRREEIAQKFIDSFGLIDNLSDDFYNKFLSLTKDKEGYLFPDTYLLPKDTTAEEAVKVMEDNFKKRVNFPVNTNNLILASILERETITDEERAIVAGILLKRINSGWPIQADATIQYVVGKKGNYWPQVTPADLAIDSSFNTYTNIGLPPSPICNPGVSSIKAATMPTESEYWYYLHDREGQIHYATTIEEHNTNITNYLQ